MIVGILTFISSIIVFKPQSLGINTVRPDSSIYMYTQRGAKEPLGLMVSKHFACWEFLTAILMCADFFKLIFTKKKNNSEISPQCQTARIRIILSSLI